MGGLMATDVDPDVPGEACCRETLEKFFTDVLGLDEKTSKAGACKLLQTVSAEVVTRIVTYITYLEKTCPKDGAGKGGGFKQFLQK